MVKQNITTKEPNLGPEEVTGLNFMSALVCQEEIKPIAKKILKKAESSGLTTEEELLTCMLRALEWVKGINEYLHSNGIEGINYFIDKDEQDSK